MGSLSAGSQLVGAYGCLVVSMAPRGMSREHRLVRAQQAMSEVFGRNADDEMVELYDCVSYWERLIDLQGWVMQLSADGAVIANTDDGRIVPNQHFLMSYIRWYCMGERPKTDNAARKAISIETMQSAKRHGVVMYPPGHQVGDPSEVFEGLERLFVASAIYSSARAHKGKYFDEGKYEAANRGAASLTAIIDKLELVPPDDKQEYVAGLVYGYGMTMGMAMAPFVQENITGTSVLVMLLNGIQRAIKSTMIQSETVQEYPGIMAELAELVSRIESAKAEFATPEGEVN